MASLRRLVSAPLRAAGARAPSRPIRHVPPLLPVPVVSREPVRSGLRAERGPLEPRRAARRTEVLDLSPPEIASAATDARPQAREVEPAPARAPAGPAPVPAAAAPAPRPAIEPPPAPPPA